MLTSMTVFEAFCRNFSGGVTHVHNDAVVELP
jgi:hypothetical protein